MMRATGAHLKVYRESKYVRELCMLEESEEDHYSNDVKYRRSGNFHVTKFSLV